MPTLALRSVITVVSIAMAASARRRAIEISAGFAGPVTFDVTHVVTDSPKVTYLDGSRGPAAPYILSHLSEITRAAGVIYVSQPTTEPAFANIEGALDSGSIIRLPEDWYKSPEPPALDYLGVLDDSAGRALRVLEGIETAVALGRSPTLTGIYSFQANNDHSLLDSVLDWISGGVSVSSPATFIDRASFRRA